MNTNLVINTKQLADFFFEKSVLWGITTPMSGFDFCHVLNVCLRLNLVRRVDLDLEYCIKSPKKNNAMASLFDDVADEEVFFPVYHQLVDLSESEIYVYANKHNGNVLIKEQKQMDFFVLVKNAIFMEHLQRLDKYITNYQKIGICRKYDLSQESWIDNLIL